MSSIATALSTAHFPADEVAQLIDTPNAPQRPLVLAAVRAESDGRFLEGLATYFESIDWASVASAEHGHHPAMAMLGAARGESATDHLAATEIVKLCRLAEGPDAAFALDVVRALEFGDAAAGARVRERVAPRLSSQPARGMYSAPDNAVASLRLAKLLRALAGGTDEDQLRTAAEFGFGHGAYAAYVAAAIAADRGLTLGEDVVSLQYSSRLCARALTFVAQALDPAFGEALLSVVVNKEWPAGDLEALNLPWERSVESVKAGKAMVTRLLGATVLKASGPFDAYRGPPTGKRAKWRLAVKLHPNAAKAAKELEKAALEGGDAISFVQADLDARLHHHARNDDGRERVAELLRRGASPNGHVDPQNKSTPLHRATSSADCGEIIKRLLAAGADVSALDAYGNTPLDALDGTTGEQELAAARLVAAGARCNKNRLFDAAERGFHRIVPALLRAGADPTESRDGKTPLAVALEKRHLRTARAIEQGAGR